MEVFPFAAFDLVRGEFLCSVGVWLVAGGLANVLGWWFWYADGALLTRARGQWCHPQTETKT